MSISRGLIGWFFVIIVVAGALGAAWWRISGDGGSNAEGAEIDDGDRPEVSASGTFSTSVAIPVSGGAAVRDTLVISVSAAAQAAAEREAPLTARVAGRIVRLYVHENQVVRTGALLAAIDSTEYELTVANAEAQLAQAEATYREFTLFDDEIEDPEVRAERDRVARARSGMDQAEVALQQAQLQLTRTKICAPFSGRVASIEFVEGQLANVGDRLMTVIDLDPIRVEVQVLESEVGYLAPGRNATILFSAFPDDVFTGTVETINPVVEQGTRTARVTVRVPNPRGRILPGMYARVSIEAREFPNRLMVPRSAILERDRRDMLFVFEPEGNQGEGLAKWRYVTTGLMNDSLVEIVANPETDMVEPGEIVLTDGHYTLIHDARIRLVGSVRAAGGRPQ
jgi:RND family efflux transporter MFP subunit